MNEQTVKVKDLPATVTEEQLREAFGKFGTISRCTVSKTLANTASAELFFTTVEAANAAVKEMNDKEFLSAKVKVSTRAQLKSMYREQAQPYQQQQQQQQHSVAPVATPENSTVVVKGFAPSTTSETIANWFSKIGKASCTVKGHIAFVNFSTPEEAKAALSLNCSNCSGYIINVLEYFNPMQRHNYNRFMQQQQQQQQQQQRQPQRRNGQNYYRQQRQQQRQQQHHQQQQQQQVPKNVIEPLTDEELESNDLMELIGTKIYEYVEKTNADSAAKVSGMILDLYKTNLRKLNDFIKSGEIFNEIQKALDLLSKNSVH